LFLNIAEEVSWSSEIHEETLKCVINCIYSRPDFIEKTFGSSHKVIERLLQLSKTRSSSSMFHLLVWKILLVSCESNEVITKLQTHKEAWLLIHSVRICSVILRVYDMMLLLYYNCMSSYRHSLMLWMLWISQGEKIVVS
jgi:hypothetical protein